MIVVGELRYHMPYDMANPPPCPTQSKQQPTTSQKTMKPPVILSTKSEQKKSKGKHNIRSLRKLELKLYLAMAVGD